LKQLTNLLPSNHNPLSKNQQCTNIHQHHCHEFLLHIAQKAGRPPNGVHFPGAMHGQRVHRPFASQGPKPTAYVPRPTTILQPLRTCLLHVARSTAKPRRWATEKLHQFSTNHRSRLAVLLLVARRLHGRHVQITGPHDTSQATKEMAGGVAAARCGWMQITPCNKY